MSCCCCSFVSGAIGHSAKYEEKDEGRSKKKKKAKGTTIRTPGTAMKALTLRVSPLNGKKGERFFLFCV